MFKSNIRSSLLRPLARYLTSHEVKAQERLDQVYKSVRDNRFEDIVVVETRFNANPRYLILASAFNLRHLINGTEGINKDFKQQMKGEDEDFARLSISQKWNVMDLDSVVVHLFAKEVREHYDIEQLWGVGEKYDNKIKSLSNQI